MRPLLPKLPCALSTTASRGTLCVWASQGRGIWGRQPPTGFSKPGRGREAGSSHLCRACVLYGVLSQPHKLHASARTPTCSQVNANGDAASTHTHSPRCHRARHLFALSCTCAGSTPAFQLHRSSRPPLRQETAARPHFCGPASPLSGQRPIFRSVCTNLPALFHSHVTFCSLHGLCAVTCSNSPLGGLSVVTGPVSAACQDETRSLLLMVLTCKPCRSPWLVPCAMVCAPGHSGLPFPRFVN